jgi:phosphatidylglycerol---prolipoprotein diacylglyceryl transferase
VLAAAFLGWLVVQLIRHKGLSPDAKQTLWFWGGAILASVFALPAIGPPRLPVFGYGMMVLIGFVSGLWLSRIRARRIGLDPEILSDLSFWLLISGVAGGRLAYLGQYWERQFARCQTISDYVWAAVNLTEGGLVLIGALVGGAVGFFLFCRLRKLPALLLVDVIMPGVFIGVGFGRIGCLLNGCCFGDPCDLPWAIQFPKGSVPWLDLVDRGLLNPNTLVTMPLHPTQVYSSIDGFLLGTILWNLYPLRARNGQLLGMGCMGYACTRFLIEFIRNDEPGRFGTSLTISQWYSMGLFVIGASLLVWLFRKGEPATQRIESHLSTHDSRLPTSTQ